jgi:hypothetical protein
MAANVPLGMSRYGFFSDPALFTPVYNPKKQGNNKESTDAKSKLSMGHKLLASVCKDHPIP